ncbi:MAG: tRNA (adenosine(37)-N6)-threonylcarbamoyltransferase complex dimerization subunit type 1 TsaB [Bacteroidetes bacterium]|nr:tRNA (adenosine(37)-N6)-threonylcarbamoyltransferase complex dimerization subunit type 1 TsaB [Bacteroidota bacterium]
MALILNIETATTVCSVSVSDKNQIITFEEVNGGYTHAENLHVFIKEVMQQAGLTLDQLNAVSVSKGPGSYTGLRIGASAAKGLAYALNIPLISIDTLQVMTQRVISETNSDILFCPMIDARRMEVYCACYNFELRAMLPVQALIVDSQSIAQFKMDKEILFFGDGMLKCKSLLETVPKAVFKESVMPSSEYMATLAYKKFTEKSFEDVAYFEPFYLKEFFTPLKK